MLREKIGPAFCCFALGVDSYFNSEALIKAKPSVKTNIGLVKTTFLREKL